MNDTLINFIGDTIIEIGRKIKRKECELDDEQASEILGAVGHIKMNKEQACKYINISRSRFDDYVRNGTIPKGRKRRNETKLFWYKDELDIAIRQANSRLSR